MRVFLMLFFLVAQFASATSPFPCSVALVHLKNGMLAAHLPDLGAPPTANRSFLDRFGSRRTHPVPRGAEIIKVVEPGRDGNIHKGIYFYENNGSRRVVKLIEIPQNPNYLANPVVNAVRGYGYGEQFGGAHLYDFGTTQVEGKPYLFVEIEELFPKMDSMVFKTEDLQSEKWNWLERDYEGQTPLHQMADLYIGSLEKGINPTDPDWIVGVSGRVKWIDTQAFRPFDWKTQVKPDYQVEHSAALNMAGFLEMQSARVPRQTKLFLTHLLNRIKTSSTLNQDEKQKLMQTLFEGNERSQNALRKSLLQMGYLGIGETPSLFVERLYKSVP